MFFIIKKKLLTMKRIPVKSWEWWKFAQEKRYAPIKYRVTRFGENYNNPALKTVLENYIKNNPNMSIYNREYY